MIDEKILGMILLEIRDCNSRIERLADLLGRCIGTFTSPLPSAADQASGPAILLDVKAVQELTQFSVSHIYAKVKNKTFPEPIRLSRKCVRWQYGAVQAWLEAPR